MHYYNFKGNIIEEIAFADWKAMRLGVVGLGHIGLPIANYFYEVGHEVFSWTRNERSVPWNNSTDLTFAQDLDFIFIASGATRPNYGNENLELLSTSRLISKFNLSKETNVVYISSGAVYGESAVKKRESDNPIPTTTYGKSKLIAERDFFDSYQEKAICLRVGNIIDGNNPYGIFELLARGILSREISFFGEPYDCRDYIGMADFLLSLDRLIKMSAKDKIINIGSGRSLMLSEIAELITSEIGGKISIDWRSRRSGDLSQSRLDVGIMNKTLEVYPIDPKFLIRDFVKNLS